ncbi:MAG: EAL domain-containing protein [Ruminiclostridium sp.]|nr:EAL domain-containing protein [Ruminiclostridium sp.]
MSKSKEKRIKKLKKNHIWPSIVGLSLILLIFTLILTAVLSLSVMNIVERKMLDSSEKSLKIAELFENYKPGTETEIRQKVLSYTDILDEIETVSVTDAEENPVWSSNDEYPVIENALGFEIFTDEELKKFRIIIDEDNKHLFVVEDGELVIDGTVFFDIFRTTFDIESTFTNVRIWYVIPVNGMNVMVLNDIHVYYRDLIMILSCAILCGVLIVIFVIYYLVSIISMAVSAHRTTKIIYTDMLTGGDNWLLFIKKATTLLKKNKRGSLNYAMLHLEMRKYRSFCTCFGVSKGQELVEKFHAVLKREMYRKETMAHQEDEAFGLLVTYTDTAQLEARIQKIENALNAVLPGMKMYFGVGVYLVQPGENDVEQLYNNAMIACEMIGDEAENRTAYFDVEMNNQKLWERKVEDDMDRALANREFQVYLQPKISTTEEVLGGAEALVRWIHPTEGFIPPNRFIPIFEKNGFILKLDDYMLEEIARVQAGWLAEGRELVPISVNVSRAHFTREDLAEHICAIVDKYQVPHSVIELELTESAFFDDKKVLLGTVRKLREAGFQVSMDDFGAGYSSLNSLKELQIDVLKIDADFFRGADVEERGLLIVSEVIDLAKKLNMKIVAEGIESREQVEFLTAQECDLIQGYFYAKPMPVAEFAEKYNV